MLITWVSSGGGVHSGLPNLLQSDRVIVVAALRLTRLVRVKGFRGRVYFCINFLLTLLVAVHLDLSTWTVERTNGTNSVPIMKFVWLRVTTVRPFSRALIRVWE